MFIFLENGYYSYHYNHLTTQLLNDLTRSEIDKLFINSDLVTYSENISVFLDIISTKYFVQRVIEELRI